MPVSTRAAEARLAAYPGHSLDRAAESAAALQTALGPNPSPAQLNLARAYSALIISRLHEAVAERAAADRRARANMLAAELAIVSSRRWAAFVQSSEATANDEMENVRGHLLTHLPDAAVRAHLQDTGASLTVVSLAFDAHARKQRCEIQALRKALGEARAKHQADAAAPWRGIPEGQRATLRAAKVALGAATDELRDVFSQEVFHHPVVAADGLTYDKPSFDAWNNTHPRLSYITSQPLDNLPGSDDLYRTDFSCLQRAASGLNGAFDGCCRELESNPRHSRYGLMLVKHAAYEISECVRTLELAAGDPRPGIVALCQAALDEAAAAVSRALDDAELTTANEPARKRARTGEAPECL